MNLERKVTRKGCVEYADPDMRGMPVPVQVPPGFVMYKVCGNGACLNPQHSYFVDGDTAHQIEIALRERMLEFLREYFKVDPDTLRPFEQETKEPNGDKPRLWTPR
jgi:hypothetical protein